MLQALAAVSNAPFCWLAERWNESPVHKLKSAQGLTLSTPVRIPYRRSLDVVERQREFAVRLAIGAQPADVLRLAMFTAGRSALVGIMGGVFIALLGTRLIRGMLFQVTPLDTATPP